MHHKYIRALAIEIKIKHKLCPEITGDIYMETTNNQYNFRIRPDF